MKIFISVLIITNSLFTQEKKDTTYQLSPVLVTATTAIERETPVTFSNLKKNEIQERYSFQDIPVLLSELPSVTMYSDAGSGIGYSYMNLRGFDQRRISVMINGIPQNDPEDHNVYWIDFPDLLSSTSEVQVQRGAGSAFYGPPAIGGSVNILTNPFKNEKQIGIESVIGLQSFKDSSTNISATTKKFAVSYNSGIIGEKYLLYGRVGQLKTDGYRNNSWVEQNSYFLGILRMDDLLITRLHFFGGPISDGLVYFGLPKFANDDAKLRRQNLSYWETKDDNFTVVVPRLKKEIENFSQPHYEMINEWKVSPKFTFHNTMFYYPSNGFFKYDGSWADSSMLRTDRTPKNTLIKASVELQQFGVMPRIDFEQESSKLTFGFEFNLHRSTHFATIDEADGISNNYIGNHRFYEYNGDKNTVSIFANELYRPAENISVMMNFQYVIKEYKLHNEKYFGNEFTVQYKFLNPKFGINYNINEEENIYISVGYTSREPRLRNLYAAEDSYFGATPQFNYDTLSNKYDYSKPYAKPEKLLDVELGYGLKNKKMEIRTNLYFMDFYDELVKSGQVDIFGQPVWGNAQRSKHFGLEIEGSYLITEEFILGGNFTISENKLVKHSIFDENGIEIKLDNNPISGFPDKIANIRGTYKAENFSISLSAKYNSSFYTDNFKNEENKNDSYYVLNCEAMYRAINIFGTTLNLRGAVYNLTNKFYTFSGEGNAFYPAAERNFIFGFTIVY